MKKTPYMCPTRKEHGQGQSRPDGPLPRFPLPLAPSQYRMFPSGQVPQHSTALASLFDWSRASEKRREQFWQQEGPFFGATCVWKKQMLHRLPHQVPISSERTQKKKSRQAVRTTNGPNTNRSIIISLEVFCRKELNCCPLPTAHLPNGTLG